MVLGVRIKLSDLYGWYRFAKALVLCNGCFFFYGKDLATKLDLDWLPCYLNSDKNAVHPLNDKGRLSAVLFQLPQSFHYTKENRFYLSSLLQNFEGFPCVVEFRHREWIKESVFEGLDTLCI